MHAVVGELGDGAGKLDAGRPATDDHEGEETFLLGRIVGIFRVLEGDQQAPPDIGRVVDLLEAGRELLPFVVVEVAVPRARRQDEIVVGDALGFGGDDLLALGVHILDAPHENPDVRLVAEQDADRSRDIGRRKAGRRDLIEQGLEQVVVAPVDHGHPAGRVMKAQRRRQAAETGTDDHHVRQAFEAGRVELRQGVAGAADHKPVERDRAGATKHDHDQEHEPVASVDVLQLGHRHAHGQAGHEHRADDRRHPCGQPQRQQRGNDPAKHQAECDGHAVGLTERAELVGQKEMIAAQSDDDRRGGTREHQGNGEAHHEQVDGPEITGDRRAQPIEGSCKGERDIF